MEENRRFSWTDLFIKIILVVIFIIFTVWLLSLSTKGLSDSLDVLTNNIFSQNMEKMKEVGKEYFTLERLPKKVGEIKTLTLDDMYEKDLILELTDKNGNACSAKDSYVSVEKFDNEYQMKVYLECGKENDFIIVIMGCYDYCDSDICEFDKEQVTQKQVEYQYKKVTNGSWTDYGKWSDWSKVSVTNTDYRQVETKEEIEEYTYDETIIDVVYEEFEATCPTGYKKTEDGTKCYKNVTNYDYEYPVCNAFSGYKLEGREGFTCTYSKVVTNTETATAVCPSGYIKSGNSCIKSTTSTINPVCPTKDGYTLTGREGFTCTYAKTTTETKNPTCPVKDGYILTREGFTCNYTKYIKGEYVTTEQGESVPANNSKYIYEEVGTAEYVYDCTNGCAFRWIHTYKVYKAKLEKLTETATCPVGYDKSGSKCVKSTTTTETETATCPSGYIKSGNSCVKSTTSSANPTCPVKDGYTLVGREGFTCNYSKTTTDIINRDAVCRTGYTKTENSCLKTTINTLEKDLVKNCPVDYKETEDNSKCYKNVEKTVTKTESRKVIYYRYRVREYVGGTTDYKWSSSKEDKKLLDAGYKLTGKTR